MSDEVAPQAVSRNCSQCRERPATTKGRCGRCYLRDWYMLNQACWKYRQMVEGGAKRKFRVQEKS